MTEYITLMGAEQVQNAACTMSSAASQMQSAASQIEDSQRRHMEAMDQWLDRLEDVLERAHQGPQVQMQAIDTSKLLPTGTEEDL